MFIDYKHDIFPKTFVVKNPIECTICEYKYFYGNNFFFCEKELIGCFRLKKNYIKMVNKEAVTVKSSRR